MSRAYYNEIDPFCAAWLRNLIAAGHIAPGDVDERSIADVQGSDLVGYDQCHFFAGIGGWSLALRLAGWPDDRPVWTGSCPCQPLSGAGQRKGHADERHLWPAFYRLIAKCAPPIIFGEQVASADGREWLAGIRADLEATRYAVGAADLCAPSVGAPHIRQRLYWLADADGRDASAEGLQRSWQHGQRTEDGGSGGVGDTEHNGPHDSGRKSRRPKDQGWMRQPERSVPARHWDDYDILHCTDGRARRIEPSSFPLATGIPARMGRLRGYGNAIVPQVAAEFVVAAMETLE